MYFVRIQIHHCFILGPSGSGSPLAIVGPGGDVLVRNNFRLEFILFAGKNSANMSLRYI